MKPYNLKKDHAELKKQIKSWEIKMDKITIKLLMLKKYDLATDTDAISHEMMAINI